MNAIQQIWIKVSSTQIPTGEISGENLSELSRQSQACIQTYLQTGALDTEMHKTLQHCLSQLRLINPQLKGDDQIHFGLLYRGCDLIAGRLSGATIEE